MGNATNETTKKTNWLDAIKAQFKRIIWPTKEEAARKYKQLIKELKTGLSIRKAAKLCDCSESTAKRIKKLFGI